MECANDKAIIEIAESLKELCRIIQSMPNYDKLSVNLKTRLAKVYEKVSVAKSRI